MRSLWPGWPLLALVLGGAPASGEVDSVGRRISELRARIEKLQEEAALNAQDAKASGLWMDELRPQIQALDIEIETARQSVLLSELELARNNDDLMEVSEQADRAARNVERQKAYLKARLGGVYRQGRYTVVKLLLQTQSQQQFLRHLHYFRRLADMDRQRIAQFDAERRILAEVSEKHRILASELLRLRQDSDRRKAEFEAKKLEKQELLERLEAHRKGFLIQNREALATSRRLARYLTRLLETEQEEQDLEFEAYAGQLRWPVEGKLLSGFGRRRHQKYDAVTVQNGITIAAEEGRVVRAVFRGRVRFAGRFHGYGKIVLLEHPGGYLTLYAHLGTLEVVDGQRLVEETILGTVGDTGLASQPVLYFELRKGLKPQNPLRWLKPNPARSTR